MDSLKNLKEIEVLGVALVNIKKGNDGHEFSTIFQKGIGESLIQNIFELLKKEIHEKIQGTSIIPLDHFSIFINYFENEVKEQLVMIYMYNREETEKYPKLYMHSRKIKQACMTNKTIPEIKKLCNETIKIPLVDGVKGIYAINRFGIPLFSKVAHEKTDNQLVAGFITALFSFGEEVIGRESGAKLKEINFGNHIFYTVIKDDVVFAYLVNNMSPLLKRYIYIIVDEFLDLYQPLLINFDGDVAPFLEFEKIVNEYFNI
ncbi:MAG: hypothetical protein EAX96_06890 [Candidatus Lokiarchaeota archaeon]|nr:hypothetical protein [Candidatus Lokiarchaeota archaeon]